MLETLDQAKIGSIFPVYKELNGEINAFEYFAKLSNYGKKKDSFLIEDNKKSIGTSNPCLVLTGKKDKFEIRALNDTGRRFLGFIKKDFSFCEKSTYNKDRIFGIIAKTKSKLSEDQRIRLKGHTDIIKNVAFKFKPAILGPLEHYGGLFGIISSDFIGSIEEIPDAEDAINDPDYVVYFVDNMFLVDHRTKKTYFIANAFLTDNNKEKTHGQCNKIIQSYEKMLDKKLPKNKKLKKKLFETKYMPKESFVKSLKDVKRNIAEGNLLYASLSRAVEANYNSETLDIYNQFKLNNETAFYLNDGNGISIGTAAGTSLIITGKDEKFAEINIGSSAILRNEVIDDNNIGDKYEVMLRSDEDKAVYHTMLIDAARNYIAKISNSGTRHAGRLFFISRKGNRISLSSTIRGTLKKDLDSFHAFAALLGFDRGLPKTSAISLIRKIERGKNGLCTASMIHAAPDENLESHSVEAFRIKKNKVYFNCVSDVCYNINEEDKALENEAELLAKLQTIKSAGEFK